MAEEIKICLNMIVKNEAHVIQRCLDSVSRYITDVVISDTGSGDDTITIIEKWIKDNKKDGKVVSHNWKNFGHNRNLALDAAREYITDTGTKDDTIWYILFMDADDYVVTDQQVEIMYTHDLYDIDMKCGSLTYSRPWMIRMGNIPWGWEGALHEYISSNKVGYTRSKIEGPYIQASREGARSQDPMKYLRDAILLEEEILIDSKRNYDNPRYIFYLAQSYRDYHHDNRRHLKMAETLYLRRFDMGGWDEERYVALVGAGRARKGRGKMDDKMLKYFMKAYQFRPTRLEAAYEIVLYLRLTENYHMGYNFGKSLLDLPYPTDRLFVNGDIYKWKFKDEVALCAYYSGHVDIYTKLFQELLDEGNLPAHQIDRIKNGLEKWGLKN